MWAKVSRAAIATVLIVMLCTAAAFGHVQTSLDEDDSPGALDLVAGRMRDRVYYIASTHPETRERRTELVLKLVTYESWEELGGMTYVGFEFDVNGDVDPEFCLDIGRDGTWKAHMFSLGFSGCVLRDEEYKIGTRTTRRPDDHSIKVIIPKRWLGRDPEAIKWRAFTSFEQEDHPECAPPDPFPPERRYGTCVDFTRWTKHHP